MKKTILALLLSVLMITSVFALDYTIELVDSYGDGWNGGSVTVNVDGSPVLENLTIEDGNGPESHTFAIEPGHELSTVYTAGSWSTENEYQIKNELGIVVAESGQGEATPGNVSYTVPQAGSPDMPILTSPVNGALNVAIDATLEWTTGDNTDHAVLYIADNAELTDAIMVDPATSPYSPTLALNTTYYWKVVAVSATALETETAVWSFTTEYGTASVPYQENFDSAEANTQPAGWISLNDTGNTYANTYVYATTAVSSPNVYRLYNSGASTGNLIGSTPKVENAGNRVRFMAKTTSTTTVPLIVGTMTDATDGATFVGISTLDLTTTYTQYIVDLPADRAEDHVSFKHGFGGTYKYIYIDDVNIEEVPTEAVINIMPEEVDFGGLMHQDTTATPTTVTISNVGGVSAEITETSILNTSYFQLIDENAYPVTLEPQASISVAVKPLTTLIGTHTSSLRFKQTDPGNPFVPINHDVALTVEVLDSTGDDHNNPFVLTLANEIIEEHTTTPYNNTYDFCSSPSVVYQLTLPQAKILDISLEGTTWDTKLWVFNSFEQIDNATQNTDAWYYNDDESGAGTGGRGFIEGDKARDRAVWSKMNPSFALAGEYYIVVSGYGTANGDFVMTINSESIPAPADGATNPFPADDAVDQPSTLTLTWDNVDYTETIDIYFGEAGSMVMVEDNIPVVDEYQVTGLLTLTEYEWKIVNRNYMGETPADSVVTWSFNTVGTAPEATTYTAPADQATDQALNGNLTWNAATGADGYYVYFSTDETFAGVTPVDQAETTYAYSGDYDTTYYWKVIPYNVVGQPTEGIVVWSFTTGLSPFPDADLVFDGTRTTGKNMPMEPYYGYTMCQNIYLQEEIDVDNSAITSISYLYNNNTAWSETVEVYMKHTTKDSFADSYDWELSGFTHVYSGSITVDTSEPIVTIELSTPFVYNNTDNLLVAFFATQAGYHSSSDEFFNYPVADNKSIVVYNDNENYHELFPTTVPSGTRHAFRPVSGFTYEEVSADPVFTVSADTLTFADQIMDTDSDSQTLTISNLGLGTLGINSVTLTGTNADQFILTDNNTYPVSLEITENISVGVVYSPNNEGDHTAQLEITDDQNRVVNVVELVGNSVDTNIYATDLPWTESFEGSLLGWSTIIESTTEYATITLNTSATNVQDGSTAIQFYNSGDLSANLQLIAPNLVPDMDGYRLRFWTKGTIDSEIILAKWDSDMTILTAIDTFAVPLTYEQTTIEFEGTTTGNERFAFIPVFATTYDYVYLDNITFEATPLTPVAELSTQALDFGDVELTYSSAAEEVTITNVGPGTLNISDVAITGTDAALFAWEYVEETPDMALENGESLAITVTFTPDALGLKEATLVITDDLARNVRVSYSSKAANTSRAANNVALTGSGWLPPQGSTCSDPLPLAFPAVDVTGNTVDFLDDYSSSWISPSSSYINGDDVVYQFTLANSMLLNGTITTTGSWMGAFILADEPNETTPADVTLAKTTSGNTLTYTNEVIPAGTYFLIISSYPSPQSIDYTINLTADALPAPEAATAPTPDDQAIDQPTALTLEWTNAAYTETIDLYFGTTGAREMAIVLDDVAAVEEYAVTDLDPNTEYSWKVVCRNYTGETIADSVVTWTFTTVGSAPEPVTYTAPADEATNVALDGNLTWQAATGANGYYVYFSEDETFAGVTPEDQAGTSYAFSGLDYETTYYWKVIPYNVVGQPTEGILVWSFITIPDPTIPMPVTIDFEGTTTVPAAYITATNMYVTGSGHGNTQNVLYKNIYTPTTSAYVQFQSMNNITATSVFEFDYRFVQYSSPNPATPFEDDFDYLIAKVSTDNGVTFNAIDQINSVNHVESSEFARYSIDISAYAGQTVIFRLDMPDDDVNDYYFDIDNIYFGEPAVTDPDVPVNFTIANDGASITLSWDAAANANSYNIYGCDTPDGEYIFIEAVDGLTHTFTATETMKFYSVKASTDTISPAKRFGRN